jgi:hypothetical protein
MDNQNHDPDIPLNALPPLSLEKFMEETGISAPTCWRYRKRGWLKTVIISRRHYIRRQDMIEFNERAARGEFARPIPHPRRPVPAVLS